MATGTRQHIDPLAAALAALLVILSAAAVNVLVTLL